MYDLVIRGGTVVDGSGSEGAVMDIAIDGDRIVAVAPNLPAGKSEIDARGKLVTPGFVDIHTHYDAQVSWDPDMTPSSWHGVTTVVMGNCGVGFAPCKADARANLIQLMEGVEDIPGAAMTDGITWEWESFPDYMNAVEKVPRVLDVACQITHGPLRTYVMGDRAVKDEPATAEDLAHMRALTLEALQAGALGFSTSRTMLHRALDGTLVPGTLASKDELFAIGDALKVAGHGVFQLAPDHGNVPDEMPWMRQLAAQTGRRVCFNFNQADWAPEIWKTVLPLLEASHAAGEPVYAQVAGRAIGVVMSFRLTAHPFAAHPTFREVFKLPWAQASKKLLDPSVRAQILAEQPAGDLNPFESYVTRAFDKMFAEGQHSSGDRVDYEPKLEDSVGARAKAQGLDPLAVAYDALCARGAQGFIYFPLLNYCDGDLSFTHMVQGHPTTRMGLSDAGAHCGAICDGGVPTFMLTHWTRDRARGPKFSLPWVIHRQTQETAEFYGLTDRGLLRVGYKADVNVIDMESLRALDAEVAFDLPAGARRLVQRARGYVATVVSGVVTVRNDQLTGARPGKLIRGPQSLQA